MMVQQQQHLKSFKVNNFKRYQELKLENIGAFNLLIGDNNVGKTSALEALLFNEDGFAFSYNLLAALWFRNIGNEFKEGHLSYFFNREQWISNPVVRATFEAEYTDGSLARCQMSFDHRLAEMHWNNQTRGLNLSQKPFYNYQIMKETGEHIPFVPFYIGHDADLTDFYSRYVQADKNRKKELIETLKTLIPRIEDIEISTITDTPILVITQSHTNAVMPLGLFGEGAIKFFRLILEIIAHANQRLMIDEIEASIHHSRFREFWRVIITTARRHNVQLFTTSNNFECIRILKDVLLEDDMAEANADARVFEISETEKGQTATLSKLFKDFEVPCYNC